MFKKIIEFLCVVCVGLPCFVIGYLCQFARAGFSVGLNASTSKPGAK